MTAAKPALRPNAPHFSSGPCAKRPGWTPQNLKDAALGRSHRAKIGKTKLKLAIDLTREVLEVPADAALRLRIACAAVEQIGDDRVADAIAATVWSDSANVDVVGGRLFLAAAALRAVERIRPAAQFAALADAASADLSWRSTLPPEHARRISNFLRLGGGSSLATLLRRELPGEAPSLSPR